MLGCQRRLEWTKLEHLSSLPVMPYTWENCLVVANEDRTNPHSISVYVTFNECWLCAISQCHLWCGMEANHSLVPHCHIWAYPSEVCNVLLFNLKLLHGTWDLEWKRWLCSYIWWLVGYTDKHYKLDLSFIEMLFFFQFFFLTSVTFKSQCFC